MGKPIYSRDNPHTSNAWVSSSYDFRNNFDVYYNVTPGAYATDVYTDEAVRIIKNHDKEPFFMMINHAAPHDPNEAPAEEIAKFTHITDPVRRVQAGEMIFNKEVWAFYNSKFTSSDDLKAWWGNREGGWSFEGQQSPQGHNNSVLQWQWSSNNSGKRRQ